MINTIAHDEVRELNMARPPANAFDQDLVSALDQKIRAAPGDGARALVISGSVGMFTGGLDVPALITMDRAGIEKFWQSFFELLAGVATSAIPVAAAITGHSPAAGAVLASFCDFRVMASGKFKIGLNEVQVGLPVPPAIQYGLKRLIGPRIGDALLIAGRLVTADEALKLGIVDKLVAPDEVVPQAIEWAGELLALPPRAMLATREIARRDLADNFADVGGATYRSMADAWFTDETQAMMNDLVRRLASRK